MVSIEFNSNMQLRKCNEGRNTILQFLKRTIRVHFKKNCGRHFYLKFGFGHTALSNEHLSSYMSPVSPVFHTEVTVKIY